MDKKTLLGLIEKYNLGGTVDSVKWVISGNKLKVDFVSDNKSLIGKTILENFEMEDCEFGVYTTSELIKMLSILDADIKIEPTKVSDKYMNLKISDSTFKMNYVLSDTAIIAPAPKLKVIPDFEVKMQIDTDFISKFLKSTSAIGDSDRFAIQASGNDVIITVGYSDNNTNRTTFKTKAETDVDADVSLFTVDQMRALLVANKDLDKGILELSSKGLMRISFVSKEYKSVYFLVKLQGD